MQATTTSRQPEIEELIHRLDLSLVEPDPDYDSDDSETAPSPPDSINGCSSFGSSSNIHRHPTSTSSPADVIGQPTLSAGNEGIGRNKTEGGRVLKPITSASFTNGNGTSKKSSSPNNNSELPVGSQEKIVEGDDKKSNGRFDFIRKLRGGSTEASVSSSSRKSSRRKTLERLKVRETIKHVFSKFDAFSRGVGFPKQSAV